jgi:hypothetical protein
VPRAVIRTSDELRAYVSTGAGAPLEHGAFRERFTALLDEAPAELIGGYAFFSLPADLQTWLDTGLEVAEAEAVTVFSTGHPLLAPEAEEQMTSDEKLWARVSLGVEARRCPWHRVGADGEVMRGGRSSNTFVGPHAGRLFLANKVIHDGLSEAPQFDDAPAPPIDRCVLVVRWAGDPHAGLAQLCAIGDVGGLVASELAHLRAVVALPDGWAYPPQSGPADQFAADTRLPDSPVIGCYSRDNTALLMRTVDLPFVPGTRLRWAWRMNELPSRTREDRLATHDYLSIAVEYDNATDITYFWSAELPAETGFPCPIPGWGHRETHVVVRSGVADLGAWLDEERDLYADYARHVGEPPARITGVWLLAVTQFQRLGGHGDYGRIELESGSTRLRLN